MITIEMLFLSLIDVENKMMAELNRAEPTQQELIIEREKFEKKYKEMSDKAFIN
jgi:pheromone shutdown protein TraB